MTYVQNCIAQGHNDRKTQRGIVDDGLKNQFVLFEVLSHKLYIKQIV